MLYALVDQETLDRKAISLLALLEHINSLEIDILQYRNKIGTLEQKKNALLKIRENYKGKIIVNDTIDLIDYADGLHLGQEDISEIDSDKESAVLYIRERIGKKILGLSTHNIEEIEEANALDLDYIGLGAYRSTNTKKDASVKGEELLRAARLSKHPVAIIGGIHLDDRFDDSIQYKVVGSGLYEGIK